MISTVLIDDQQECIDDLHYLFEKIKLPVKVVATANSGAEGLAAILKHKPQLVFLDIVMPGMSGFEMLELIPDPGFHLVVTTSVDAYAIQAIRSSAIDFLLKPVKSKELEDAITRSVEKHQVTSKAQINLLHDSMKERNKPIKKIALAISDGVELVNTDDILYFESDGNYTTVFLNNGKEIVVSKPIGRFEEITNPAVFFRIHNSYLVNLNRVNKFIKGDGGYVALENGKTISVSRNRKDAFLEALARI
jgi:two-component system, LytTR family, response regulator